MIYFNKRATYAFTAVLMVLVLIFISCAGLKNLRTSTSIVLNKAPYYHGKLPFEEGTSVKTGFLPITTDIRIDPEDKDVWQDLLKSLTEQIDSLNVSEQLPGLEMPLSEFPDVYAGSPEMFGAPVTSSSYDNGDDNYIPPMVLYYKKPSVEWKQKIAAVCESKNLDYVIIIFTGLSEYMIHQKNIFGKKELELGTGYSIPVKWLKSLDDPVDVVHVTGVLVDKTGKIRRCGAEGILAAKRQSLLESAIGIRNAIGSSQIKEITKNVVRKDLHGNPPAYKVALQNLVANLIGRNDLIIK